MADLTPTDEQALVSGLPMIRKAIDKPNDVADALSIEVPQLECLIHKENR
jgi:hypothetical protein